jgi:DNA-binding LacI/PurR family transcriptional regulator
VGRVTLQTIADRVGVSRTTVSNAWSRPDQLSEDLRQRILDTAEQLGYPGPHALASSLRSGRVGAIGLVVTEQLGYAFDDPYAVRFLRGVVSAVEEADAGLLLLPLPPGRAVGAAVTRAILDGVLVYSMPAGHPVLELLRKRDVPVICVDQPQLPGVPWVGIDDREAMRELVGAVVSEGHRRLLVLTFRVTSEPREGPLTREQLREGSFRVTAERLAGVLAAVDAADGVVLTMREVALNTVRDGRAQVTAALASEDAPTAIVALSDELAFGAIEAVESAGLEVPTDVSVVGFDDIPDAARHGLTTVAQPSRTKGEVAARLLLGGDAPLRTVLTHSVVRRNSLAAPPSR